MGVNESTPSPNYCFEYRTVMQPGSSMNATSVDIGRGGFLYRCGADPPIPTQVPPTNVVLTPTTVHVTMQPGMGFAKAYNYQAPVQPRNLTIVCNK